MTGLISRLSGISMSLQFKLCRYVLQKRKDFHNEGRNILSYGYFCYTIGERGKGKLFGFYIDSCPHAPMQNPKKLMIFLCKIQKS